MRILGQPVHQNSNRRRLATETHRHSRRPAGRGGVQSAQQAQNPDPPRRKGHLLHALARHHRQPHIVQSGRESLSHDVLLLRPHPADRVQFRHRPSSPGHVDAHRTTRSVPRKHFPLGAREEEEEEREEAAKASTAPAKKSHIATLLLPAYHLLG